MEMAAQLEDSSSKQSILWNAEHDRYVVNHLLEKIGERFNEKSITVFRRIFIAQENAEVVAKDMGMTLGAARVAQHRVLKALKEEGRGLVE